MIDFIVMQMSRVNRVEPDWTLEMTSFSQIYHTDWNYNSNKYTIRIKSKKNLRSYIRAIIFIDFKVISTRVALLKWGHFLKFETTKINGDRKFSEIKVQKPRVRSYVRNRLKFCKISRKDLCVMYKMFKSWYQ